MPPLLLPSEGWASWRPGVLPRAEAGAEDVSRAHVD